MAKLFGGKTGFRKAIHDSVREKAISDTFAPTAAGDCPFYMIPPSLDFGGRYRRMKCGEWAGTLCTGCTRRSA